MNFAAYIMPALMPAPDITVSEWADNKRILSPEASAEPGQWNTNRAPYQRGIMDAMTDPDIYIIVIKSSAQIGKTELILNLLGYRIDVDPCPIMIVQPTVRPMAEDFSKDRLAPMLRDTPCLQGKVKISKSKDSKNTMLHKAFPGGHVTISGANSPASLASRPIRDLYLDEIDRYPVTIKKEGDPVELVIKRTETFLNKTILMTSTPTIKDMSRIDAYYQETDQRKYFVPCPYCGKYQLLYFHNIRWESKPEHKPETTHYVCNKCGKKWNDLQRWDAIAKGQWRATTKSKRPGMAGFHIWTAYSPFVTLENIVRKFLASKGEKSKMQVFVNTTLGETFEEVQPKISYNNLWLNLREDYKADIPKGGLVLTAGIDTQDNRVECEVKAWGFGFESWSVDYWVLYGIMDQPDFRREIKEKLEQKYKHESGIELSVIITCHDSGGHYTNQVYSFADEMQKAGKRYFACKGSPTLGQPLITKYSRSKKGYNFFLLGTDTGKETLMSRLVLEKPGPGYMHFPMRYTEEYFKQIVGEVPYIEMQRNYAVRKWKKVYANEVLDINVLNMAAIALLNPNFEALKNNIEKASAELNNKNKETESETISKKIKPKSSWVNNWRR